MPSDCAALHDAVQRAGLVPLLHLGQLLPQPPVGGPGVGRDHHPPPDVPLEARRLGRLVGRARLHHGVAVADARRDAEQHRDLPALRNLDGREHEIIRLLRVGRLEHRHAGRDRVTPVVLLVLARSHARIVGGDDDQRAAHAGVGGGEERVGGHVEADVFHRAQRPRPAESRADGDFQRHLLVRRPLGMPAQLGEVLQDFGGGRARDTRPRAPRPRAAPPARWLRRRLTAVCLTHSFDKMRGSLIPAGSGFGNQIRLRIAMDNLAADSIELSHHHVLGSRI